MTHPSADRRPPATSHPAIRRAGVADARVLAEIGAATFVETFGHLYPPADLAHYLAEAYGVARTRDDLADPARAAWLAEAGGRAVGYAAAGPCALPHPDVTAACGELKRLYLTAAWRNGGLGARLFGEALDWLERDGPRTIWLGVWSQNHGAQRFYARRGFAHVGDYGFRVGRTVDHEYIFRRPA
jgi:GNAT superfamily N-acetyltransferase